MDNREIDVLIAEKVMGFKLFTATKESTAIINGSKVAWGTWVESGRFVHEWGPNVLEVKRYSADITAAWDVVEKLGELGYWAQLRTPFDLAENNDGYWCGFTPHLTTGWNGRPDHWTNAPTITMAICLAALKCLGV